MVPTSEQGFVLTIELRKSDDVDECILEMAQEVDVNDLLPGQDEDEENFRDGNDAGNEEHEETELEDDENDATGPTATSEKLVLYGFANHPSAGKPTLNPTTRSLVLKTSKSPKSGKGRLGADGKSSIFSLCTNCSYLHRLHPVLSLSERPNDPTDQLQASVKRRPKRRCKATRKAR